jgi:hypothetical protein
MPCYFGRSLKQLINWMVTAQRRYPEKRILATKLDVKAAFQRCHLNTSTAVQTCTQLPELCLAVMMLRLSFGGAPCPSEWVAISESVYDLIMQFCSTMIGIHSPFSTQPHTPTYHQRNCSQTTFHSGLDKTLSWKSQSMQEASSTCTLTISLGSQWTLTKQTMQSTSNEPLSLGSQQSPEKSLRSNPCHAMTWMHE